MIKTANFKYHVGRQMLAGECKCLFIRFCMAVLVVGVFADPACGADGGKIIGKVSVEGNKVVSSSVIFGVINSRDGAVLDEKLIAEDAHRIMVLPQIQDVSWQVKPAETQVDVIFTVVESSVIQSIEFVGNKHIKEEKLLKEIRLKESDFLDIYLVSHGVNALEELYHKKGYYFVTVTLDREMLKNERKVAYTIVEGPRIQIKKVEFVGRKSVPKRKLKKQVKTKPYFFIFRKGLIDDEQMEQDILSLAQYYHDEGYLDAQVFVEKPVFNEKKTRATIKFVIEEGPQYRIADIRFEGNEKFSREKLLDELNLESGKVFKKKSRIFAEKTIRDIYGRDGYIYANVSIDLQYTDQQGVVDVVFKILENERYMLGQLIVRGNYQTQDKVVRRDFDRYGFLPGSIYNTEAMERGRRRLGGSGFFNNVTVSPVGQGEGERDAEVEVTEARTGLLLFGVGVDTNSGVSGRFSIQQNNFDISRPPKSLGDLFGGNAFVGGGQRMQFEFSPGTRVTTGRVRFYEPYLFDQPYYFETGLSLFRRWRESYLEGRRGGSVTLGRRFENDWSIDGTLRAEVVQVSRLDDNSAGEIVAPTDVQDVEGDNLLTSIKLGVGRDTTDRMFRPTEGYKLHLNWEQVGVMGGEHFFGAANAGGTVYRTVYKDIIDRRTVLSAHTRSSKIIVGEAPVFERYYAGGIGSIRGFEYRGISPRSGPHDDPVGSEYLFTGGTELVHPLFEETLYGKVFCDGCMIDDGPGRVSVGIGIEIVVPQLFQTIPMQFDFAFPVLSDKDNDEEQMFSFNFGMGF